MQMDYETGKLTVSGVTVKPRKLGSYLKLSKTQLTKILKEGNMVVRCSQRLTDDYAFDAAYNFGKTEWEDFDKTAITEGWTRDKGMGVEYEITRGWYSGLSRISVDLEDGVITLSAGNSYYKIKEKEGE